jgi:hypothetical protein
MRQIEDKPGPQNRGNPAVEMKNCFGVGQIVLLLVNCFQGSRIYQGMADMTQPPTSEPTTMYSRSFRK